MTNYIKTVEVSGIIENRCIIRMSQSEVKDSFMFWSMETDIEVDSFACSTSALIFYDKVGYDYILDDDYITMVRMSGRVRCYQMSVNEF